MKLAPQVIANRGSEVSTHSATAPESGPYIKQLKTGYLISVTTDQAPVENFMSMVWKSNTKVATGVYHNT
jgi:hypothetical protein